MLNNQPAIAQLKTRDNQFTSLLLKSKIYFSRQKEICEGTKFTGIKEGFEQISDKKNGLHETILK